MAKALNKKLQNAIRREYVNSPQRILNQQKACRAGKNVMVTVENPNKEQTNMRYIRVPGKQFFTQLLKPGTNSKRKDLDGGE